MFIVKIWAGLANQMFQYAFYKSLLKSNKKVFVDNTSFTPKWEFEHVNLEEIFPNIEPNIADPALIKMFNTPKQDSLSKIKRRLLTLVKQKEKLDFFYIKEPTFTYNSFFYDLEGDYYLDGFWQTEKYFKDITEIIRYDFIFPGFRDKCNIELGKKINNENAVSIHVRKGPDYKKSIVNNTCNRDYYVNAINFIKAKTRNPIFYVFSDNMPWCKDNLKFCKPTYVDWNPVSGLANYIDMQLISKCKHNIIANSSYSWWGAWLNENKEKIIIVPHRWFNNSSHKFDTTDLIPEGWVKI